MHGETVKPWLNCTIWC